MLDRRNFIKKSTLASFSSLLGTHLVFGENIPAGYRPLFLDQDDAAPLFGKHKEMTVFNDRPWNIEAKAHLLDDAITPPSKMFVRNNGLIPTELNASTWTLTIDGESVMKPKTYSLQGLKSKFKHYTYQITLECGGNGRSEFNPPAKGIQWTIGAVSCAEWTGVRLKDILSDVGIKEDAVYIGYFGTDTHLSGDSTKPVISRGVPISKALQNETLLAFKMNGEDIPIEHGFPLRLVAGGWPASASGKWINRLSVRNIVHDGAKMLDAYRVPCGPVAPGTEIANDDMCIIESMPVKSLITFPKTGAVINEQRVLDIRGHAWAGELSIKEVHYSIDYGVTWKQCKLQPAKNRLAWQQWEAKIKFPQKGYFEVWAKATDSEGMQQPMLVPGWNPQGYLNNACHRIAIKVV